ncbi:substrate-binding domain-containing protein [Variovorax sp. GT1P44]|uniref:substrate-binding domain-containing protein n=1 Tax=Variovorax sp. GT1P44 TaxID=3443742 RepID=UPI003F4590FE
MKRRQVLRAGLRASALACVSAGAVFLPHTAAGQSSRPFRFGTTPVFLDDQVGFLARWAAHLSGAMGMPVEFVQRRSYRDIMVLLRSDALDAAWICGFPWVVNKAQLHGVSIPMYRDGPWYQSYLIVPAADTKTSSLLDLRAKVFAYSDPDSNSGCLVPRTTLMKAGVDPDRHFSRSFFTWGHRNVVQAVAAGLAQGGAVDGYVWDTLQLLAPGLVEKTRVAWRSDFYGFPPVAARGTLDADTEQRFRAALLGMADVPNGKRLLNELNLTAFGTFQPEVFDGIASLVAMTGPRAG